VTAAAKARYAPALSFASRSDGQNPTVLLFPFRIDVTTERRPVTNWLLLAVTVFCFFWIDVGNEAPSRLAPDDAGRTLHPMVAQGWGWGLLGHVLLHNDFLHLLGNCIFLWVFGNAVCSAMHPAQYLASYFGLGFVAIGAHLAIDGGPAVGASGAINGLVGMCTVWYPMEYVSCVLTLGFAARTFEVRAWIIILLWLALDVAGAILGLDGVAYLAHIAGLLGGAVWAVVLLKTGWVTMPSYQATLLDLRRRR
jgi:membrane associated rhomboid family serine protease